MAGYNVSASPVPGAFKDLFGETLLTKDGEKPTEEVLGSAKAVGLYFSAHWCPPCRGFTPKLAEWYSKDLKGKGLEIVFVSSDKDDATFGSYFGEQPWAALPFAKRDKKDSLSKKFKVQGIPSFVILDADGKTITNDGREAISKDPTGEKFPWTPPTAAEKAANVLKILGHDLLEKAAGKSIGLYFSAHWCPPCRGFTPKLAEFYNNGLKDKMEIIFVSSDRDEGAFKEYAGEMPWLALPFEKRKEKEELSDAFGVQGIPSFAVINPDGTVITTEGRSCVMKDPEGKTLPSGWLPQPFNDVNDDPSALNEEKCLLALGGEASMAAAVKTVAEEYYANAAQDISAMPIRFFTAPDGGVVGQIRSLTKQEGNQLVMLDIPSDGAFYVCDNKTPDAAAVKAFIAEVEAGKAEKKQLQK